MRAGSGDGPTGWRAFPCARCDLDFTVPSGIPSFGDLGVCHALEVLQADDRRFLGRKRRSRARRATPRRGISSSGAGSPTPGRQRRHRRGRREGRRASRRWMSMAARFAIVASHEAGSRSTSKRSAACHARTNVCWAASSARSCRPRTRYATAYASRPYAPYTACTLVASPRRNDASAVWSRCAGAATEAVVSEWATAASGLPQAASVARQCVVLLGEHRTFLTASTPRARWTCS